MFGILSFCSFLFHFLDCILCDSTDSFNRANFSSISALPFFSRFSFFLELQECVLYCPSEWLIAGGKQSTTEHMEKLSQYETFFWRCCRPPFLETRQKIFLIFIMARSCGFFRLRTILFRFHLAFGMWWRINRTELALQPEQKVQTPNDRWEELFFDNIIIKNQTFIWSSAIDYLNDKNGFLNDCFSSHIYKFAFF